MLTASVGDPDFRRLAVWDGDEMIAAANLFVHGKIGSLNSAATLPGLRNRGAQSVTTMGTSAHGAAKPQDADVVRRLRAAGATVLGKTTLPELCIWSFTETITFGATRNPWDTMRTPGGSSDGSAAAVAAGLAPIALGSDAGGSIRIPATWCGLFGIKAQRYRPPTAPRDNDWNGLSVNGPLTRTVEDAALFLDATTTAPAPEGGFVAAAARPPGRLRIALSTKVPPPLLARVGEAQRSAVRDAGELLLGLGHHVIARDPDYPAAATIANWTPRYFCGIHDDVQAMPRSERLEARTHTIARLGALISDRGRALGRAGLNPPCPDDIRRRRCRHHARSGRRSFAHRGLPETRGDQHPVDGICTSSLSNIVQRDGAAGSRCAMGAGR
jgi:hypothetical protein